MKSKYVTLLGVPSDLGANKDGSARAPKVIRTHLRRAFKKANIKFEDLGDVVAPKALHLVEGKKRHYPAIKALSRAFEIKRKCDIARCFPLVLGGDHTVTMFHMGWISRKKKMGLMYFDSHGDFNTPKTTLTGNIHGMVVARCVGKCLLELMPRKRKFVREENVVLLGIRDLDPKEKELLDRSKITVITMKAMKKMGCKNAITKALKIVNKGTDGFHLSVDLDVIDPRWAPAVSTPVKGGLSKKEFLHVMKMVHDSNVLSADFVEYIPKHDTGCFTAHIITEFVMKLIKG